MAKNALNTKTFTDLKRIRRSFGHLPEVTPMPNLIEVQKSSYDLFLQLDVPAKERQDIGLESVFKSIFPINDFAGHSQLDYVSYEFEKPKYDVEECQQRGITYAAPLKATLRLIVWDVDEDTGAKSVRDVKEQDVYMGDIPLMTNNGTFIVNGTERVIISQMHRSPGVFFDHDGGKTHSSGKLLFSSRIIPYRGSWLDFEFDAKDIINVRIDRRRKLPATTLLLALDSDESEAYRATFTNGKRIVKGKEELFDEEAIAGLSKQDILGVFYDATEYKFTKKGWVTPLNAESLKGTKAPYDFVDAKTGDVVLEMGSKITARTIKKLDEQGVESLLVETQKIIGKSFAEDIVNTATGLILAEAGDEVTEEVIATITAEGIKTISLLAMGDTKGPWIRNTLEADKNETREQALTDIYRVMRPGEPPTLESADALLHELLFDAERYDLSDVGRVKINSRLAYGDDSPADTQRTLLKRDILEIVKILCDLRDGKGDVDDIDHLGNRRVRSVGELMENQYRLGLSRMERAIRERMSGAELETAMPHDLINSKPVAASVREFFGSSQLSQFMDQTNPLSEITHKRRLSALGPGGLTRERAGFEVRDVHPTHYGRICPIETPEGPNIGLINTLSTYARVNQYGFIETPYRRVENGKVTDTVDYMSATDEGRYIVAQSNTELTDKGEFVDEFISCRERGENVMARPEDIQYMDVAPKQLVSAAAALIPFLENDDANRALMGANMQRQAVPLLRAQAPLVGTGIESRIARDSGVSPVAKRDGIVDQVDASRIVIRVTGDFDASEGSVDIYNMLKFQRSNQNTCINQRPLVKVGDVVKQGDIIADGPSTQLGELALGRNMRVAFMPWNGYNFEDSILISERIVRDDVFTSIHIEEFEVMARDTKLGPEEITRDIPNVGEDALANLDETGIVYVGAEVKAGDILVGKVTPKGESPMTPEEKLLRAIFGEKASEVRDSSLRVKPGDKGTVVDVRVFNRRGVDKDERTIAIERAEIERLAQDRDVEKGILERSYRNRFLELADGVAVDTAPKGTDVKKITKDAIKELTTQQLQQFVLKDEKINNTLEEAKTQVKKALADVENRFNDKVDKVQAGDDLPPGVMKMVKVFVAVKRKLQPGDKMAGRHGNKGVISRIMPVEDMPYLENGEYVDVVLNPLGVPSRMNVGQILETHLGWAASNLGIQIGDALDAYNTGKNDIKSLRGTLSDIYETDDIQKTIKDMDDEQVAELANNLRDGVPFATPVFDGAREPEINRMLEKAGVSTTGQSRLIDGRTGEYFDRDVTVGIMYILKLHHLVDDKLHARSIGPYSLVTQQPLGGKAQFGGQRFGEMEVWALEAYGAAYTLQEMLTVKSDDVAGRTKVYESIVRGDNNFEAGIPESFNVLIKEMRSLGLNVELKQNEY